MPRWQPFTDTVEALRRLKRRGKLVILSNIDDDLFAGTTGQLEIQFDQLITARQVRSYKPSLNNFRELIRRAGVRPEQILHAAQSVHHDIVPAKHLGLKTVRIERRSGQAGSGAPPPAVAEADWEMPDLQSLTRHWVFENVRARRLKFSHKPLDRRGLTVNFSALMSPGRPELKAESGALLWRNRI